MPVRAEKKSRRVSPPGRGRLWPGALAPRAWGQRGTVAGAMAPASGAGLVVRTLIFRHRSGREQETHAFPPPARNAATRTRATRTDRGQRPPGAGRALAGGFGPPAGQGSAQRCGRGDSPCRDEQGAQAEAFPAFRSGSPCGRSFFSTPPRARPGKAGSLLPCRAAHQVSGPLSMYRRARKSIRARTLGGVTRPGG